MNKRVWTKVVIDVASGSVLEAEGYAYDGDWALAKGDDTAKQSEQLSEENQQQQMNFNQQLMGIFQQQFKQNDAVLQYIQGKMQPMIDNPQGYDQQTLASMRTSADDTLSTQYQNAQKTLNATEFANGSRDLPSGVNAQLDAGLLNAEAVDKAGAQNQITQADANLKQQNYWNAVNTLSGVAAQYNPEGYAGAATGAANSASSAGGTVANTSQAVTTSNGPTFGAMLGGLAGGIFGAAGNAGGFSSLFGRG